MAEATGNDCLASSILRIQSISAYWQDDLAHTLSLSVQASAIKGSMLDMERVIGCAILQGLVLFAAHLLPGGPVVRFFGGKGIMWQVAGSAM